ncbi:EAL domain-containing protein [Erythrobacter sp. 3-20A1M]|uniref:putative bifunctional diguanylate cyclase/phosphodiesterase n=1 Tax=Erythrobacter sp. 3-20A1M TaxID=2653850 RepID=UPI001BFC9ADE|nr:EAL domain-containing protein [Erythrobacter sp. 3-20A1M]QWC56946.1 EAL domain-containing protein [Erythrobacter sp. 3-20A1M]
MYRERSVREQSRARLKRTIWRDALIIFGVFTGLLAFFISVQAFEHVVNFSDGHESWELDEILTAIMVLPVAMAIFSLRRLREVHAELEGRIEAEEQAQAMAMHDPLTGLPNRRNFNRVLDHAITDADERPLALLLIDLNRFKAINDLHGHRAGDDLLIAAASRLAEHIGPLAFVGRLGGDEFVVLLKDVREGDALIARLEKISACFDPPFQLAAGPVSVGASIGVTYVDTLDLSADAVLSQADAAMYECKQQRGNGFRLFEAGMETVAIHRAEIEAELRDALRSGRIEPFYQPLVRLEDGRIIGYEVLARWRLDDGSLRMPDDFIAVAEEAGLISNLFYALLERAAADVRQWPADLIFAVNLSPVQFGDAWLIERVLQILTEAGVAPGRLEIEITENALVTDIELACDIIRRFKRQGIKIALDDFGTGYSSLRHLGELEFDKLKIDRSFIANLQSSESSRTIVRTITAMAHNLGLQVTVEGIENAESARSVIDFGCDIGQGYLYGRPASEARLDRDDEPGERVA